MLRKTCLVCGKVIKKPQNESLKNWNTRRKYCSKNCTNKAPRTNKTRLKQRLAKIGKPSWNRGLKLSETHKRHLRKKHGKLKDTSKMMGRRPWNKIGNGITPINEKIRKSKLYKKWRESVFKRDKYICAICRQVGGNLQAHHIKPFSQNHELRLTVSNGITLCTKCHKNAHPFGFKQWKCNKIAKNTNAA